MTSCYMDYLNVVQTLLPAVECCQFQPPGLYCRQKFHRAVQCDVMQGKECGETKCPLQERGGIARVP